MFKLLGMALTKIPEDFQNTIKACSVNTVCRAVEELVYNSVDAGATSVAVRVNVKDYFIQVIDNGTGMNPKDLTSVGKVYMTSKFEHRSNTEPKYYGFRGQSISAIVKLARKVKITTRCVGSVETWSKEFISGIEQNIKQEEQRPSRGTTVEVKDYLCNAVIRRKAIEEINELNNIKSFLEKVAIVNTNLSLSLRNNCNNEILLTIHKNRDVWQTLALLDEIDINKLKELQVEKNQYKVKAYIVTNDITEGKTKYKWIYLNRLFIRNSKIQNTVDGLMKKHLRFHSVEDKKAKLKTFQEENLKVSNKKSIPSYFIFISCPYDEYDNSRSPKLSFLEFKNWDNLNKILEKLVKFYIGDLKTGKSLNLKSTKEDKVVNEDTRTQVRKIIERVLGNKSKKSKITKLQNGVTGKNAKRRQEKKTMVKIGKSKSKLLEKEKPCIEKVTTLQTKDPSPNPTPKLLDSLAKSKRDEQHTFTLNNLKKPLSKDKSFKSDKNFHEHCAALKRKCDELEIRVDRILMQPKKKKPKKVSALLSNNTELHSKYGYNFTKNTQIVKRIRNMTLLQQNIHGRSPYFSKPIVSKRERSLSPFRGYMPIDDQQWKSPNIGISTRSYAYNTFNVPYDNSVNFNSHQELSLRTFQSHGLDIRSENNKQNMKKFISKQSIDNFGHNILSKTHKHNKKKAMRYSYNFSPKHKLYKNVNVDLRETRSSYTIEFSKTNELTNYERKFISSRRENTFTNNHNLLFDREKVQEQSEYKNSETHSRAQNGHFMSIVSTDTIRTNCGFVSKGMSTKYTLDYGMRNTDLRSTECNSADFIPLTVHSNSTYQSVMTICSSKNYHESDNIRTKYYLFDKNDSLMAHRNSDNKINSTQTMLESSDLNVVFVSETQQQPIPTPNRVNPVEICEVLLDSTKISPRKRSNDNQTLCNIYDQSSREQHSFSCMQSSELNNALIDLLKRLTLSNSFDHDSLIQFNLTEEINRCNERQIGKSDKNTKTPQKAEECSFYFINNFKIKDRQRFLPKGMSPINNCIAQHCKGESRLEDEYFDPIIYFNFLDNLQTHYEIYEPDVQNMKTVGTKEIQNFGEKVIKDNASLVFNRKALENTYILGQVDSKFIAAKIECNYENTEASKFLVLFDQHAAHERIRLENNLIDYLEADKWKSVDVDKISLKLAKEEILYIHNYKDKFNQFGLKWTSINNHQIEINGIPEAILGKNPRQEDKIIMTVKEIISEIIKSLQTQRGCVPLYLKTIMDLVFSEACRYAIKFGDKLTIDDCKELISDLSNCKTPFQCAHGRPVMAVLMELKDSPKKEYLINRNKLLDFVKNLRATGLENRNF